MSRTPRFVISIVLVLLVFTLALSAALIGSGPATGVISSPFISGFDGRYLGLVVLLESVQLLDGCHRADLLGRQVYLVCGLENIFIGGCVEGAITYVGPYVHREFVGPQGQDGGGAAAA